MGNGVNSNANTWLNPDDADVYSSNHIGIYATVDGETTLLAEVLPATKRRPFRYRFNKDYAKVFLRIRDGIPEDNFGAVLYSIKHTP